MNPGIRDRLERLEIQVVPTTRLVVLSGDDAAKRLERWKAGETVEGINGTYRGGPLLVIMG